MKILKLLTLWLLVLVIPCQAQSTAKWQFKPGSNPGYYYLGVSGSILDGSTVLSGTGIAGANGFPASVPAPQHYWDFANNYNDGASVNPLNMAAGGSGNTFGVDWAHRANQALVLNGSGYAQLTVTDPDVNNLGAVWSILINSTPGANVTTTQRLISLWGDVGAGNKSYLLQISNSNFGFYTYDGSTQSTGPIWAASASKAQQLILTFNNGTCIAYLNNSSVTQTGMATPQNSTAYKLAIGAEAKDASSKFTGSIHKVAIWKNTCLTAQQVSDLFTSGVVCDEANTYARWYAATPGTVTKSINGATSTVSSDTWGSEAAGKYGYAAYALRYHAATTDLPGNPGGWPQ